MSNYSYDYPSIFLFYPLPHQFHWWLDTGKINLCKHQVVVFRSPSSLVTPRQPISSCRERALSLLISQYSTNFFTHFFGLDFLRRKRLKGFISFFPMSPLEFLSSWLKYQWTTRSSRVWLGSGSAILSDKSTNQLITQTAVTSPNARLLYIIGGVIGGMKNPRLPYLPADAGSVTACTMSVDSASRTLVRNSVFFAPGQPGK